MKDSNNIYNREDAFRWLLQEKCGNIKDLKVSRELFRNFYLVGYIHIGTDGKGDERWKVTKFGDEQMRAYLAVADQIREVKKKLEISNED